MKHDTYIMLSRHAEAIIKAKEGEIVLDKYVDIGECINFSPSSQPCLRWRNKGSPLWSITPLSQIKKYFHYTEPKYYDYLQRWLNIYPNQYEAAMDVLNHYDVGMRHVILTAEMQSGKTGTVRYVAHNMLHCSNSYIVEPHQMFFICGMNDNDLRAQAIAEFSGIIPKENILFSMQLQKWNKGTHKNIPAFVVIDESHYAGNKDSQVDLFMKGVEQHDPMILSVSATAMAELATSALFSKGRVYLRPGDGYYSIKDLFVDKHIKQSIDITKKQQDFIDLIAEEYDDQEEHDELKYNIVRLPSQWYYKDIEEELTNLGLQIGFINHHSGLAEHDSICVDDFNKYLIHKPDKFTIIWIYNSLRAGKQLNTEHIGFVHDTASSSPDTIAQSLLGRILGYGKRRNRVTCYTDVASAKLFLTWVNSMYDVLYIPTGSRGIIRGYTDTIHSYQLHKPYLLTMPIEMRRYYKTLKQLHGNRYPYKDELFEDLIKISDSYQVEISDIFDTYEPGRCGGLTIMTEYNAQSTYRDHWSYNYKCYMNGDPVRGFDVSEPGRYYHVYVNLHIYSEQYGQVLITYKEYINGTRTADNVKVNAKSRFSNI